MEPAVKNALVSALRSGAYAHHRYGLRANLKSNACCVMGVLCDLYDKQERKDKGLPSGWTHKSSSEYPAYLGSGTCPEEVRKWAGLPDPCLLIELPKSGETFGIALKPWMYHIPKSTKIKLWALSDAATDFGQVAAALEACEVMSE